MTSTIRMRGARLGMGNAGGLVRMWIEGVSRAIGKRSENEEDRSGDGDGGRRRRLLLMLRRKMG
jgi:hypothetical protein